MGGGTSDHATDIPSYKVMDQHAEGHASSTETDFFSFTSEVGVSLCIGIHHAWDMCTSPTPCKPTSTGGETKMMPQENIGSVDTQCPTSKTSLGWINGKLQLLLWTSTGVIHRRMGEDHR